MRNWYRAVRSSLVKAAPTRPIRKSQPSFESLEDRTVLQSGLSANQAFVTAAYNDLLQRAPDAAGLAGWTSLLDSGQATTMQVALSIVNSLEFRIDAVQNAYQTFLHRAADPGGLNAFVNFLATGGNIKLVDSIIIGSQEYFQVRAGGTNAGFLQALYQDVLHRAPDAFGLQAFTAALDAGVSRQQVALLVLSSPEGTNVQAQTSFNQFLQLNSDPTAASTFVAALTMADPPGSTSSASQTVNTSSGSSSDIRNSLSVGANVALPLGTTVIQGFTVPAGGVAISLPGVTVPPGAVLVLFPGQTLPTGATILSGVTIPAGAETIAIPGVTVPAGTIIVPTAGATINGVTVGGSGAVTTNGSASQVRNTSSGSNTSGSASDTLNTSGSASQVRNTGGAAAVALPAGTAITPGVTVPAGGVAISVPGVNVPTGAFVVLLPGQILPTGATILSGVTIPTGAETITVPGVTAPTGTVLVPAVGATINGQVVV
jgi:hypothetical protein